MRAAIWLIMPRIVPIIEDRLASAVSVELTGPPDTGHLLWESKAA